MACPNTADRHVTTEYGVFRMCLSCFTRHVPLTAKWTPMTPAPAEILNERDERGHHIVPYLALCQCEHVSHQHDGKSSDEILAAIEGRRRIDPIATDEAIKFLDKHRVATGPHSTPAWNLLFHASTKLSVELREYLDAKRDAYPEPAKGIGEPPEGYRYPVTSAESQHYIETGEWPSAERVYFAIYLRDEGTGEAFHTHYFCSEICAVKVRDEDGLKNTDVEGNLYSAIEREQQPGTLADGTVCESCDREIR